MKTALGLLGGLSIILALSGPAPAAGSPYVRLLALEQARSLGAGELARDLSSSDEQLAARAALAIGRTKQKAGIPLLEARLGDRRIAVRAMAVYGLGLIGDGSASATIVRDVASAPGAVQVAALDAVGRYTSAGTLPASLAAPAVTAIARQLERNRDPIVRARAASALFPFAKSSAASTATAALESAYARDPDATVRWHVMWTIFRAYATRVPRSLLVRAAHDPSDVVRVQAARALGRTKDARMMPTLKTLLGDRSWRVQEQASEAIRGIEGKPPTISWKRIPSFVHLPAIGKDPLAKLPAIDRKRQSAKPTRPTPEQAIYEPKIDPRTAAEMNGPAHGPHPRVRIVTTKGNIYVTLYPEWAPLTVANFLNLANRGYYDHNRWFRIVPDFVVQTGDPNDNGNGDAGYSIGAEENPLEQISYVISMGMNYDKNGPERDSAGTQFYVTLSPQLHLDQAFTVFGRVTAGEDVLAHLVESDRMLRVERIPDVTL